MIRWALLADPAEDGTRLVRAYLLTAAAPTLDEQMTRAWGECPEGDWSDVPADDLDPGGEWVKVPASAGLVGDDWRLSADGKTWLQPEWLA